MKTNIHDIFSDELRRNIKIRVALPTDYNMNKDYQLVVTTDAQNFFDVWEGEHTKTNTLNIISRLVKSKNINEVIFVGIDTWETRVNLDRFTDFSPWISSKLLNYIPSWNDVEVKIAGGRGEMFASFIINTLLPFLESMYSISNNRHKRAIIGSSMGAIFAIYLGTKYNSHFAKIGALSPALWCFEEEFLDYLISITKLDNTRLYMDIGRKESSDENIANFPEIYLKGANKIHDLLKDKISSIMYIIDNEGTHSMKSIASHLPTMFNYLSNNET